MLPSLCGRDPAGLDAGEIARAVIESVAENTSDAVVAPLLWGAVAGIPGLAAYRAVNTLDAMVGYRSPRYLRFGWASARLDDVANWLPARVTAALAAACAPLVGKTGPAGVLRITLRDGGNHPSPNAGPLRSGLRRRARRPPGRDERLRGRGRDAPGTGGGERPGTCRHPARDHLVPGGHRVRDRPGRAPRAPRKPGRPG